MMPGALSLGFARADVELRTFFRRRETVVFTGAMPVLILLVLGSVFGDGNTAGVTHAQFLTAGMIAGGIASASFITLAVGIANDHENGTLRRLRGAPTPPVSYFLGKVVLVGVVSLAEVALMFAIAMPVFDVTLPTDAAAWVTFAWTFVLGVTACSLLGIALSSLARTSTGAAAMSNLILLVLQFISGVYVQPLRDLPGWLVHIGALFPVKWMAQGFRSVLLPDHLASIELAGTWEHGRIALVLGAWCVAGLVLCVTTFRWRDAR
jgi:ABC-2 type transport system permease protein